MNDYRNVKDNREGQHLVTPGQFHAATNVIESVVIKKRV